MGRNLGLLVALVAAASFACASWAAPQAAAPAPQQGAPPVAQSPAGQSASAATPASPTDIVGIWQGTLPPPPNGGNGQRIVIKVTKDAGGAYHAALYNADRGSPPLAFNTATVQGADVKFTTAMLTIEGTLSADGKTIDAKFAGGPNSLPVSLARTDPDAAWAIPEAPKRMAAGAMPKFDVVTVKPSPPGNQRKNIGSDGHLFRFRGANLNDMIALGYGLHTKQIAGAPDWAGKDLFDIEGTPDLPGSPNMKQMASLIKNLLEDRFGLKFHMEKRELPVYAITVAPGGPKLTETTAAPDDPSGMGFGPNPGGGVNAGGRNLTMADFAMWFQSAVTDRPVVDQTGIKGRYDLRLKWMPDDSQFAQFGSIGFHVPTSSDAADAPPSLYTAFPEQLGLKITAVKAEDDVMVIDHVEKPSAN